MTHTPKEYATAERRGTASESLRRFLDAQLSILQGRARCLNCGTVRDLVPSGPGARCRTHHADATLDRQIRHNREMRALMRRRRGAR